MYTHKILHYRNKEEKEKTRNWHRDLKTSIFLLPVKHLASKSIEIKFNTLYL